MPFARCEANPLTHPWKTSLLFGKKKGGKNDEKPKHLQNRRNEPAKKPPKD